MIDVMVEENKPFTTCSIKSALALSCNCRAFCFACDFFRGFFSGAEGLFFGEGFAGFSSAFSGDSGGGGMSSVSPISMRPCFSNHWRREKIDCVQKDLMEKVPDSFFIADLPTILLEKAGFMHFFGAQAFSSELKKFVVFCGSPAILLLQ